MKLQLDLQVASAAADLPDRDAFARWARAALQGHRQCAEISLRVVDEDESASLNATYRQQPHATNVLSFPAELPAELGLELLGDLVICAPVVQREAAAQGKPAQDHWAHMTVHGTLHLLGFDHVEAQDADIMEGQEISVLSRLNIPNPYACAEDSTQNHG